MNENSTASTRIETEGGAFFEGSVTVTSGGTLIGRDQYIGYSAEQVRALIAEMRRVDQPKIWDGRVPFKGLDSFREADALFFHGREQLVEALLHRVKRIVQSQSPRFLCVAGPSGSGKSSLLRAGLLYALKQDPLVGSDPWLYADLEPERDPIGQLAQAMARVARNPTQADYLKTYDETDALALHKQALALLGSDPRQQLVVLVDQFEELFTQTHQESLRDAFVAQLLRAATQAEGRVFVLLVLRSDFISQCAAYPDLRELMSREFQLVGAMTPDELARAIALPVLEVGASIEPELVAQVVADMKGEPGALPLVQFALRDLFAVTARRPETEVQLTLQAYLERGGVDRALERHADAVLAGLGDRQRRIARKERQKARA